MFTNDIETQELTINIYDNDNLNGEHYFLLDLQVCNDGNYAVVSPGSLTVYIRDNEGIINTQITAVAKLKLIF